MQNAKKLDARSKKGIFVGYDRDSPAYLVYYPESNKVERVRCAKFLEQSIYALETVDDQILLPTPQTTVDTDQPQNDSVVTPGSEDMTEDNQADSSQQGHYPKRTRNKPKHLEEFVLDGDLEDITNYTVDYCYRVANIPTTYPEALKSNEATKWQKAMDDEMTALTENETYELVTPPEGRQIVGGRWVFAVKTGPNGQRSINFLEVSQAKNCSFVNLRSRVHFSSQCCTRSKVLKTTLQRHEYCQ